MCVCVSVEVSTRMVSEYKTKLQISEAENSRLEGTVSVCAHVYMYVLTSFPATYMYVEYGVKGHPSQFYGGEPENGALHVYNNMYVHDCMKYMYICCAIQVTRLKGQVERYRNQIKELVSTYCTPQTVHHRLFRAHDHVTLFLCRRRERMS